MFILRHLISLCVLAAAAMAFLMPVPHRAGVYAATQWQCGDLDHFSWQEMDAQQRSLADACDRVESDQNWVAAYGAMNHEALLTAAVYEPH